MGTHEAAYPKALGLETIKKKAKNQNKERITKKKSKTNLFENKENIQKTVQKSQKRPKTVKNIK